MSGGSCRSGPHFFKILLGDFSERLRIPPAFAKQNVMDPSQRAQLKGPTGHIWYVQLSVRGKDTYLEDGWKKFVEDHSLKEAHFLLFRYEGNGLFTVRIFDKTACEIEETSTCNTSKKFIPQSAEEKGGSPEMALSDNTDSTQRKHMPTFKINQSKKIKTEHGELTMSKTCFHSAGNRHISKKQSSTTEETTKAFDNATAFSKSSKFPNYLKIMNKSGVSYRSVMRVPTYFMMKHLPKGKASISLIDPKGRLWEVIFVRHLSQRGGSFSRGWPAFSCGNNLREGDVCLFELVGECQMRVHIFRSKLPAPIPVKSYKKTRRLTRASHF